MYDEILDPEIKAEFELALNSRPLNGGVFNETLFYLTMPFDVSFLISIVVSVSALGRGYVASIVK